MITIKELQNKWDSIPPFKEGVLLVSDDHLLKFHVGYSDGRKKCFYVLNTGKLDDKVPSSKAIDVENAELTDRSFALKFTLNLESLDEIFVKLCWDLMSVSRDAAKPVDKVIAQFKSWMKLLHQTGSGLMPPLSQKGLIGELMYMSELMNDNEASIVLNDWVGPDGADQDFNFDDGWAEVKTTTISSTAIRISSLEQLDRTDEGKLIVYFLDSTTSQGTRTISLDEAVECICCRISNQSERDLFMTKLTKCGYQEKDAQEYSQHKFRLSEKREYRITSDFPRLTKKNVSSSVTEAQYSIDLPSVNGYLI